ncbi:hypothetical protein ACH4ZU_08675 [Streptomyces sp. NPDC020472]|uniref:YxiG-like protein n=1 Tax=Streptomyces sp. NPDC020472 TaxID=3365075 RepID=UPI0037971891
MRNYEVVVHATADPRTGIAPPQPRYLFQRRPVPRLLSLASSIRPRLDGASTRKKPFYEPAEAVCDRSPMAARTQTTVAALTAAVAAISHPARNAQASTTV